MKMLRQLLVACCVMAGIGMSTAAMAAEDKLPQTALGGGVSKESVAQTALKKDATCTRCHDQNEINPVLSIYQTKHGVRADSRTPTCQSCHGDSDKHLKGDPNVKGRASPDVVFKKGIYTASQASTQVESCMACHESDKRTHWDGSEHQRRDIPCASCHTVHVKADAVLSKRTQPDVCYACHKTQRADTHKISTHPLDAGKMSCSDCHNPHGSTGPKLMTKNNFNETCYTCHAEKRGPFLWEHGPVIDDCTNCHTPHGSTNPTLLKARLPWLCQQCHSGDHANASYSAANLPTGAAVTVNGLKPLGGQSPTTQLNARACLNCHILVHGSNHPAGAKFQR